MSEPRILRTAFSHTSASFDASSGSMVSKAILPAQSGELWHSSQYVSSIFPLPPIASAGAGEPVAAAGARVTFVSAPQPAHDSAMSPATLTDFRRTFTVTFRLTYRVIRRISLM